MAENQIHIIKTGGTIEFLDPAYEKLNQEIMKLDTSIETYINNLVKPHFTYTSETIFEKDSRDITQQDREKITEAIKFSLSSNVILTHGTFTMMETAEYLETQYLDDKKVILTGAMIPIMGFAASDAGFNLGFAIASFPSLLPGIYISMNGGIFKPGDVVKNETSFRFE